LGEGSAKVLLVGHSVGGLVARAALLLDNHPSCLVRDLMQLGSPNTAPPFAPDASLSTVYRTVNRAYAMAQSGNESLLAASCKAASGPAGVGVAWGCGGCLAGLRLVSVTGGAADLHVAAELTDLRSVFPPQRSFPQLVSGSANSSSSDGFGIMSGLSKYLLSPLLGLLTGANTTAPSDDVLNSTVSNSSSVSSSVSISEDRSSKGSKGSDSGRAGLQYVSLRSSQLKGVGFPVDHAAAVWCRDLLGVVAVGMKRLIALPPRSEVRWGEVFPMLHMPNPPKSGNSTDVFDSAPPAPKSRMSWEQGAQAEAELVGSLLPWGWVQASPLQFLSLFLMRVPAAYLALCCLALTAPLLALLSGNALLCGQGAGQGAGVQGVSLSSSWALSLPWQHLGLPVLGPYLFSVLQPLLPAQLVPHTFSLVLQACVLAVVARLVLDSVTGALSAAPFLDWLYWLEAYLLAIALRLVLLALLQAVRAVARGVYWAGRVAVRATVWCQPVRRAVRWAAKSAQKAARARLPFYVYCEAAMQRAMAPCAVMAVLAAVCLSSRERLLGDGAVLGWPLYALSAALVTAYLLAAVGLLAAVVAPPFSQAQPEQHCYHTELSLAYLPVPVLAFPGFACCLRLLFSAPSPFHAAAPLYTLLLGDLTGQAVGLGFVAAHLWACRRPRSLLADVAPLRWLLELMGPHSLKAYSDVFGDSEPQSPSSRAESSTASDAACTHEDGGKFAVYEEIPEDQSGELVAVAKGVVMGSTYRVASCACAKDFSLQGQAEWCGWCRCRKCGGKHLPPERSTHVHSFCAADLADWSADTLPVLALLAVVWLALAYVPQSPYRYLQGLGAVAVAYIMRDIAFAVSGK